MTKCQQSRRLASSQRYRLAGAAGLVADVSVAGHAAVQAGHSRDRSGCEEGTEHLIFRNKKFEVKSREASEQRPAGTTWEQALSTAAVSLGLLAITFAVFAVVFREEKLLAGIAATLGVAAIAVQLWWAVIAVVLVIFVINAFLSFLS